MDELTVGIDIGTTSIKAVVVDADGSVLRRARLPHALKVRSPLQFEHDAERAWRLGPRRALRRLGVGSDLRPLAVAVTAMVPSLTAVDPRGRTLTAGLLYGDSRGQATATDTRAGAPGGGAEVAGFLRWTAGQAPGAHGYWPAQAVANRSLGGRPAVDYSVAFTSAPLFGTDGWDTDVCIACGADPGQLPEVIPPGQPVGRLGGRRDSPILTAGSVDVWCEQLVAGAAEVGDVHVICGTTLIVWALAPADGPDPHPSLWSVPHARPGLRMIGGASNAGGLFLDWAGRLTSAATAGRRRPTPEPTEIPVWTPYPRGERTPYHDSCRRAALHDLDLTHGPAAVRQASWEASAFVVRHHLDLAGVEGRRIVATGGGTRVDGWMQALADGTGLPVHVAAHAEGAARGAAFLARLAAGAENDLDGATRWAATRRVMEPRPEWAGPAARRYRRFVELSGPPAAGVTGG